MVRLEGALKQFLFLEYISKHIHADTLWLGLFEDLAVKDIYGRGSSP